MSDLLLNKKIHNERIAIMHDYFRVLGGAEKLVINLAQHLGMTIITSEATESLIRYIEEKKVKLIIIGKLTRFPLLLPPVTSKRFYNCDFSKDFDKFIFSGSFSIYAAEKHKPNLWYCHTPLKGLYKDEVTQEEINSHENNFKKSINENKINNLESPNYDLFVKAILDNSNQVQSIQTKDITKNSFIQTRNINQFPITQTNSFTDVVDYQNKNLYAKAVNLKKKYISFKLVPPIFSSFIDPFMNNFYNILVQTKDITKDSLIQAKDITKDSLIQTKDIIRDSLAQAKDITRDSLIQTRDITKDSLAQAKDSLIQAKDITKDSLIQAKDITKDSFVQAKDITRDSLAQAKDIAYTSPVEKYFKKFINITSFVSVFINFIFLCISLRNFNITKKKDSEAVKNFNKIVCNSKHTKKRCDNIYGIDSLIVYPPISDEFYIKKNQIKNIHKENMGKYWLSINRLIPHKRVELQLEAFKHLSNENLIIAGGFDNQSEDYARVLFEQAQKNVTFAGFVTDEKMKELVFNCKGFISTAQDEDFGMTVVEAMAAGKPVIAPAEGGYLESIVPYETGILLSDINSDKLKSAIREVSQELQDAPWKYQEMCITQAERFNDKVFFSKMKKLINQI